MKILININEIQYMTILELSNTTQSPNKQKFTKPQKSENLGLKMHAMNENA